MTPPAAGCSRTRAPRSASISPSATLTLPDGSVGRAFRSRRFARYCLLNGVDELGFLLAQRARDRAPTSSGEAGMKARIAVLAGDGIGPEVIAEALRVPARPSRAASAMSSTLDRAALRRRRHRAARRAAAAGDARGLPALPMRCCSARSADRSGPRRRRKVRPGERAAAAARGARRLCEPAPGAACTRRCATPRRSSPRCSRASISSSCASSPAASTSAPKTRDATSATDLCIYTDAGDRAHRARGRALARTRRRRLLSIDKANVLETSRLWREVCERVMHE